MECYRALKDTKNIQRSIGTLGGGNHFIEVDADEENNKYLVIHTGSRQLGKQVAEYYQKIKIRSARCYDYYDKELKRFEWDIFDRVRK